MSTHNIGVHEEISKIISELSSNIIKYAPYFFCCRDLIEFAWQISHSTKTPSTSRPRKMQDTETLLKLVFIFMCEVILCT